MTCCPALIQIDPRHALLAGQACRWGRRIILIAMHFYACSLLTPRIQRRPLPTTNKQGTNEMRIEPNFAFTIVAPDTVAECWNGVLASGNLYETLWGCVDHYKTPSPEESEEPCYGMDCVADFWDRFTPEQQATLNAIAERN
jgi:hypothetical protein